MKTLDSNRLGQLKYYKHRSIDFLNNSCSQMFEFKQLFNKELAAYKKAGYDVLQFEDNRNIE